MSGFGKTTIFNSLLGNRPDVFCWTSDYLIWSSFWSPEQDISCIWRLGDRPFQALLKQQDSECGMILVKDHRSITCSELLQKLSTSFSSWIYDIWWITDGIQRLPFQYSHSCWTYNKPDTW